jgi:hypothetical protein
MWARQDLNPEALLRKNNARIEIKGYKSEKGEGRKCGQDFDYRGDQSIMSGSKYYD